MPSDPRVHVTVRLGTKGFDWLGELADSLDVDRSAVIRAALAVAKRHEPELKLAIKEQT